MVSFFGLKIGGDKKKAHAKTKSPNYRFRLGSDASDDQAIGGNNLSRPGFQLPRPDTASSNRDNSKVWRAPYLGAAAASSMVDLAAPRKPGVGNLRYNNSDANLGTRFANGSSTSLVKPAPIVGVEAVSTGGSRPATPTGLGTPALKKKERDNSLGVHFGNDSVSSRPGTPLAAMGPKNSLEQFEFGLGGMDDTQDLDNAPSNGYPSPPPSIINAERPSSSRRNQPSALRNVDTAGPMSLPSPAASVARTSEEVWETPVIRNVQAKRDTLTFQSPRRRSFSINEVEEAAARDAKEAMEAKDTKDARDRIRDGEAPPRMVEGFLGNLEGFDFGESVRRASVGFDKRSLTPSTLNDVSPTDMRRSPLVWERTVSPNGVRKESPLGGRKPSPTMEEKRVERERNVSDPIAPMLTPQITPQETIRQPSPLAKQEPFTLRDSPPQPSPRARQESPLRRDPPGHSSPLAKREPLVPRDPQTQSPPVTHRDAFKHRDPPPNLAQRQPLTQRDPPMRRDPLAQQDTLAQLSTLGQLDSPLSQPLSQPAASQQPASYPSPALHPPPKTRLPASPPKAGPQRAAPPIAPGAHPSALTPGHHAPRPEHSSRLDHSSRPDHSPHPDHSSRPDHAAHPEHTSRPDHAVRPDHSTRSGFISRPLDPPPRGFRQRLGSDPRARRPNGLRVPPPLVDRTAPRSPYGPPPDEGNYMRSEPSPRLPPEPRSESPFGKSQIEGDFPVSKGLPRGRLPPRVDSRPDGLGPRTQQRQRPMYPPPKAEPVLSDLPKRSPQETAADHGFTLPRWDDFDRADPHRSAMPAPLSPFRTNVPLSPMRPPRSPPDISPTSPRWPLHSHTSSPISPNPPSLPSPTFPSLRDSISSSSENLAKTFEIAADDPPLQKSLISPVTVDFSRPRSPGAKRVEAKKAPPRPGPMTLAPSQGGELPPRTPNGVVNEFNPGFI